VACHSYKDLGFPLTIARLFRLFSSRLRLDLYQLSQPFANFLQTSCKPQRFVAELPINLMASHTNPTTVSQMELPERSIDDSEESP
jgi:hypothetical protein